MYIGAYCNFCQQNYKMGVLNINQDKFNNLFLTYRKKTGSQGRGQTHKSPFQEEETESFQP